MNNLNNDQTEELLKYIIINITKIIEDKYNEEKSNNDCIVS